MKFLIGLFFAVSLQISMAQISRDYLQDNEVIRVYKQNDLLVIEGYLTELSFHSRSNNEVITFSFIDYNNSLGGYLFVEKKSSLAINLMLSGKERNEKVQVVLEPSLLDLSNGGISSSYKVISVILK